MSNEESGSAEFSARIAERMAAAFATTASPGFEFSKPETDAVDRATPPVDADQPGPVKPLSRLAAQQLCRARANNGIPVYQTDLGSRRER